MAILDVTSEEQRQKYVTQLQQLRTSPGWKIVVAHIKELLAATERDIMKLGGNTVVYSEQDISKTRRRVILETMAIPDRLIEDLTGAHEEPDTEADDPYGP